MPARHIWETLSPIHVSVMLNSQNPVKVLHSGKTPLLLWRPSLHHYFTMVILHCCSQHLLVDPRGLGGTRETPSLGPISLTVLHFGKTLADNRLVPPLGNPGSATDVWQVSFHYLCVTVNFILSWCDTSINHQSINQSITALPLLNVALTLVVTGELP